MLKNRGVYWNFLGLDRTGDAQRNWSVSTSRLRMIFDQATQDETSFADEVKVNESDFGGVRKGNAVAARLAKCRFLVHLNTAAGFTRRSFPTRKSTPCAVLLNSV